MKITKEIIDKSVKIFDKHFPHEKKLPVKEKEKIVKFFLELHKRDIKFTSVGKYNGELNSD